MAITRKQHAEIERQRQEEADRKNALIAAVRDSLSKRPVGNNMSNQSTNDDYMLIASSTLKKQYHQGRPLGREHTDPMDQPFNMNPITNSETLVLPRFTAAHLETYRANRLKSMFDAHAKSDVSADSNRSIFNSSGESTERLTLSRETLSSLSVASEIDEMKFRISNEEPTETVAETTRVVDHSNSSENDDYSIYTDSTTPPLPP